MAASGECGPQACMRPAGCDKLESCFVSDEAVLRMGSFSLRQRTRQCRPELPSIETSYETPYSWVASSPRSLSVHWAASALWLWPLHVRQCRRFECNGPGLPPYRSHDRLMIGGIHVRPVCRPLRHPAARLAGGTILMVLATS